MQLRVRFGAFARTSERKSICRDPVARAQDLASNDIIGRGPCNGYFACCQDSCYSARNLTGAGRFRNFELALQDRSIGMKTLP